MLWFLFAFIRTITDGLGNIIDGHLSNQVFKSPWVLLFYSGVVELLFLPLIFLFGRPTIFSWQIFIFFPIIAFLDFLFLIFYYLALRNSDTSVIASLFSLGKISVPILAFFIVGEKLGLLQYIAFLVIIFSSALLTISRHDGKIKFNHSFILMLLASFIGSVEGVLYKYVLGSVDWLSGFFYVALFSALGYILIGIIKRKQVKESLVGFKNNFKLVFFNSILVFISNVSTVLAFSLAPITLVKGVSSTQPFFVILFTFLIPKRFNITRREKLDKKNLIKKIILFTVIFIALIFMIK